MEGVRKLMSRTGSYIDKKNEGSPESPVAAMSAKSKLSQFRLKMGMLANLRQSTPLQRQQTMVSYENTYKLEPDDTRKFSIKRAEQVIHNVFEHYLRGKKYDPKTMPRLAKALTELIRDRVKTKSLDRYKVVATVTVIQNKNQGIQVSGRALWNHNFDNFASITFEGQDFYAVGSVYAVYYE